MSGSQKMMLCGQLDHVICRDKSKFACSITHHKMCYDIYNYCKHNNYMLCCMLLRAHKQTKIGIYKI